MNNKHFVDVVMLGCIFRYLKKNAIKHKDKFQLLHLVWETQSSF